LQEIFGRQREALLFLFVNVRKHQVFYFSIKAPMAAETKNIFRIVLHTSLDHNLLHIQSKCELGNLEVMTKYGLAPRIGKT
jgi:hypothetical protein